MAASSYSIGIICALKEEKAAVETMLDEEHKPLTQKSQDPNNYTFGKIHKHNVVIACLPGGRQGTTAAATTATHMMHSFPIKLGLMVGIGGGVPSQIPDIRLGDVVVSLPSGTQSGVVQYDLGKVETHGFRRKGHLTAPPAPLLAAVASLQARHERGPPELANYLDAILQNPLMATKYGHQGSENDRLFHPSDSHPSGNETCDECLLDLHTVHRDPRTDQHPRIFYGTIGSGNLVIKNGEERDRMAAQESIICFEMEAAGLMNDFPCLVIRGISDYADSHKNDRWQPYAASTAAAYAKELLSVLDVQEVDRLNISSTGNHEIPFSLEHVPVIDDFVPRHTEMQNLENYLLPSPQPSQSRRKVFTVSGLGGMGKTQLCVEFARKHKSQYSAVLWLDGSSPSTIQQSFLRCAGMLPDSEVPSHLVKAVEQGSLDLELVVQGVLAWMCLPSNRGWLLIIDNVDRDFQSKNSDPQAYDMNKYLPSADHGSVIITSRLSNLNVPGDSLRLTQLDREQSLAILKVKAGISTAADIDDVSVLLDRLGGLPLALAQAGAYIRQTGISINEYLGYYEETWEDLMREEDNYPLQEYSQRSVLTTWKISYAQVSRQSTEAAHLLKLWAFLYHGDLWYELLESIKEISLDDAAPEWLTNLTRSRLKFRSIFSLLMRYSLVERKVETDSYSMHSVLHIWCRCVLLTPIEVPSFNLLAAVVVAGHVPFSGNRRYWIGQRRLLPHAQQVLLPDKRRSGAETLEMPTWASYKLGHLFRDQDKLEQAEPLFRKTFTIRQDVLGFEHIETLRAAEDLGITCVSQRRYQEAEEMFLRVLEGKEKILGPDHWETLDTVNNLGNIYRIQHRLEQAEPLLRRALGGELHHMQWMTTASNLGSIYSDQGKQKEAEDTLRSAYTESQKVFGTEHTETLRIAGILASVLAKQHRYEEAGEVYAHTLMGFEEACGPDRSSTLDVAHNFGTLLSKTGDVDAAEQMFERAIKGYTKLNGAIDRRTLQATHSLGFLYSNSNRLSDAEKLYNQALEGYRILVGSNDVKTLEIMQRLAVLYAKQDNPAAEEIFEKALKGFQDVVGMEDTQTMDAMVDFGIWYRVQERYGEAEEMLRSALTLHENVLGPEHDDTIDTAETLEAVIELRRKKEDESRQGLAGSGEDPDSGKDTTSKEDAETKAQARSERNRNSEENLDSRDGEISRETAGIEEDADSEDWTVV